MGTIDIMVEKDKAAAALVILVSTKLLMASTTVLTMSMPTKAGIETSPSLIFQISSWKNVSNFL